MRGQRDAKRERIGTVADFRKCLSLGVLETNLLAPLVGKHRETVGDDGTEGARDETAHEREDTALLNGPEETRPDLLGTRISGLDLRLEVLKRPDDPPANSSSDTTLEEGTNQRHRGHSGEVTIEGIAEHEEGGHETSGTNPGDSEALHE